MSTHALNETNVAAQGRATAPRRNGWRGVLVGLIPILGDHFTPASRTMILGKRLQG